MHFKRFRYGILLLQQTVAFVCFWTTKPIDQKYLDENPHGDDIAVRLVNGLTSPKILSPNISLMDEIYYTTSHNTKPDVEDCVRRRYTYCGSYLKFVS